MTVESIIPKGEFVVDGVMLMGSSGKANLRWSKSPEKLPRDTQS